MTSETIGQTICPLVTISNELLVTSEIGIRRVMTRGACACQLGTPHLGAGFSRAIF
jgi:hypothetical protein